MEAAKKFTVKIAYAEEWDGELAVFKIINRAGRAWCSKTPDEPCYLSEQQYELEDYLNKGGKLDPSQWEEVS